MKPGRVGDALMIRKGRGRGGRHRDGRSARDVDTSRILERQATLDEIARLREPTYYRARVARRIVVAVRYRRARPLCVTSGSRSTRCAAVSSTPSRPSTGGASRPTRYPEYLDLFDSYNDSVASWEDRERRLRTAETSCHSTIEEHNAISDTLQTVLAEAGIEAG